MQHFVVVLPIEPLIAGQKFGLLRGFRTADSILVDVVFDDSGALAQLHNLLLTTLEDQCGLTLDTPQYSRHGYRSHITATKEARAEPGALIQLNQIALVDVRPCENAGNPTVVSTIDLVPMGDRNSKTAPVPEGSARGS